MYLVLLSSPSRGGKNGGKTLGKFVKLLGKTAEVGEAIAEALRMAKGFLPVTELPWDYPPPPTRLEVPLVLVLSEIPFLVALVSLLADLGFISGRFKASSLNYSMLYRVSLILSSCIAWILFNHSFIVVNSFFL